MCERCVEANAPRIDRKCAPVASYYLNYERRSLCWPGPAFMALIPYLARCNALQLFAHHCAAVLMLFWGEWVKNKRVHSCT